jgi:hypothetical protein
MCVGRLCCRTWRNSADQLSVAAPHEWRPASSVDALLLVLSLHAQLYRAPQKHRIGTELDVVVKAKADCEWW